MRLIYTFNLQTLEQMDHCVVHKANIVKLITTEIKSLELHYPPTKQCISITIVFRRHSLKQLSFPLN